MSVLLPCCLWQAAANLPKLRLRLPDVVVGSVVDATKTRLDFICWVKRSIVSLGLSADEVLLDMVEPDRIAALTYLADDAGIRLRQIKLYG